VLQLEVILVGIIIQDCQQLFVLQGHIQTDKIQHLAHLQPKVAAQVQEVQTEIQVVQVVLLVVVEMVLLL